MSDRDCFDFYKSIFPNFDENKWNTYDFRSYAQVDGEGKIIGCLSVIKDHEFPGVDHIWLCGVNPKYRNQGIFKRLIGMFQRNCTNEISIATYPERWPIMYNWIKKRGELITEIKGKVLYVIPKDMII